MHRWLEWYGKYREILHYLIVGGLTTVVSLGSYYLCVCFFLDPETSIQLQIANVISWIAAVSFAYAANRRFVFYSKSRQIGREAFAFFLSRVGTLLVDMGIMFLTVTLCGMNDKLAKLLVQVVVTVSNYVLSKIFVFRKREGAQAG